MKTDIIANVKTRIEAPVAEVWKALVEPQIIKQYMFGTEVVSDWKEGSPITWAGEWKGKSYKDKGKILQIKDQHVLQYSHFSPLAGLDDKPENYHTVTIELFPHNGGTEVELSQDNNSSQKDREHSEENWNAMLEGLKTVVEKHV